jgi:23S rRNA pseudouridine2605 synthase
VPVSEPRKIREGERLAKRMARMGLCSRREAEDWIKAGRVTVNGRKTTTPAYNVNEHDSVKVDGKLLGEKEEARLWLYHKPTGLITTHKDPQGRQTIFDHLPNGMPRVISVGRLDLNSEGLILLTNDGELARKLELPSTGWIRRYRVRAWGDLEEKNYGRLRKPMTVDGVKYQPVDIKLESKKGDNGWFVVGLREGKNREIRKLFEAVGMKVNRLIRVSYGPFSLGQLAKGDIKEVSGKVLKSFIAF